LLKKMPNNLKKIWIKETFLDYKRPFMWIAFVVFIVYFSTLFYDIVYLDDNVLVVGHYQFNSHLTNVFQAFGEDIFRSVQGGGSFYRPILRWSFILDAQLGEKAIIFMSHFTNMLLHIFSVWLLFCFLLRLEIKKGTALLCSLIFAVHPLTSQTVALIAGRNDSLLAIFVFPSLIYFLDFLKNSSVKQYNWHLVFFVLALFTKETAVALPVVCLTYIIIFIGFKKVLIDWKKYFRLSVGWVSILIFWFVVRREVLGKFIGNADYNIFQSILDNFHAILPMIGKIILPFGLAVFPIMQDTASIYGVISLVLLAIWFFLSKKKNDYKLILFGASWFFIFILPTLIKSMDTVPEFSENRLYLPMFGFILIILGLGRIKFFEKFEDKKSLIMVAVAVITVFSSVTIYRNQYYKDKTSFWKSAVMTSPSFAFNHNNLGAMYYLDKKPDLAQPEFKKALELNPKEKMAHNNLGLIYMDRGEFEKSEEEFGKEMEINPYYDNGYANRGLLHYKMGKKDQAVADWKKALEINPNYSSALYNLAALYFEQKNFVEASKYAGEIATHGLPLPTELQKLLQPTTSFQLPDINLKK